MVTGDSTIGLVINNFSWSDNLLIMEEQFASTLHFQKQQQRQQQELHQQLQQLQLQFIQLLQLMLKSRNTASSISPHVVSNAKIEFSYNPEQGITFRRTSKEIFRDGCKYLDRRWKVKALLQVLSASEQE